MVYAESNAECANNCKYVVLAVKPQYYPTVLKQIRYAVTPDHVIISLAPGITIAEPEGNPWLRPENRAGYAQHARP